MTTPRVTLAGKRGQWLLDLDLDGRIHRYSTAAATVTNAVGISLYYVGGLADMEVAEPPSSVAIAITARPDVPWAQQVARGMGFGQSTAILRWWYSGQVLEQSRVVVRGRISGVEYGGPEDPLSFSVDLATDLCGVFPSSAAVVDSTTWPVDGVQYEEVAEGACYPYVFGCPGYSGTAAATAATPAYLVDVTAGATLSNFKVLIAGHRVVSTQVRLFNLSADLDDATATVSHCTDLMGRTVAYCNLPSGITPTPGGEWAVAWDSTGGMQSHDSTGALRGAGEVLRALLRGRSLVFDGVPADVDLSALEAARGWLDSYHLDFCIAEPTDLKTWIDTHLLWWLPAEWVLCGDGVALQPWHFDARARDAVASLSVEDHQIERRSTVREFGEELANDITIRHSYSRKTRTFTGTMRITGDPDAAFGTDHRILDSPLCRWSRQDYGQRSISFESHVLYEKATVAMALRALAWRHAMPRQSVVYQGGNELDALNRGDAVLLTDADLCLSDAVALVRTPSRGSARPTVELEILRQPVERTRSTS